MFWYWVAARSGWFVEVSDRPAELSTMMRFTRDGTVSDSSFELWRLAINSLNNGRFDRGAFRGRLVSVDMMRWAAVRWFKADWTCALLKAGFKGTSIAPNLKSA